MTVNSPTNPYQEFTVVIPAKANGVNVYRANYNTRYFRILSTTQDTVSVLFFGGGQNTHVPAGIGIELPQTLPWVELRNTGAADITVIFAVGDVKILDNRFVITGSINASTISGTTFTDVADVPVLAGATTKVLSANANTKTAIIGNLAANATKIRIGSTSAGAARGSEWPIGANVFLDTSGDVYVFNPSGSTINISVQTIGV